MKPQDVTHLDPATIAPPQIVDRNPKADHVGHGRVLPLIGNARPYIYDAIINDGKQRVYADTPAHVLAAIIDGYQPISDASEQKIAELETLAAAGEQPTPEAQNEAEDLYAQAAEARIVHANTVRVELQKRANTQAQDDGVWEQLRDDERGELEDAANGLIPFGIPILVTVETGDIWGGPQTSLVQQGIWETNLVPLVLNRGDYGLYSPEGVPEPESTMTEPVTNGDGEIEDVVVVSAHPKNLIILDPGDDITYLESLERAGVVSIERRPVDLPDDVYTSSVELGQRILEEHPELDLDETPGLGIKK